MIYSTGRHRDSSANGLSGQENRECDSAVGQLEELEELEEPERNHLSRAVR